MDANRLIGRLENLRMGHQVCADSYYSCPNATGISGCDCGADAHNEILDEIIADLREFFAGQPKFTSGDIVIVSERIKELPNPWNHLFVGQKMRVGMNPGQVHSDGSTLYALCPVEGCAVHGFFMEKHLDRAEV